MAVTRTASNFRLGAPADAVSADTAGALIRVQGFLVSVGVNPGTVVVNDKADGSGSALCEVVLKSNTSFWFEAEQWANGGFKANAGNPAGSVVLVFAEGC